jgi:hypothetical protein
MRDTTTSAQITPTTQIQGNNLVLGDLHYF